LKRGVARYQRALLRSPAPDPPHRRWHHQEHCRLVRATTTVAPQEST
jgi:hypothetical protein